MEDTQHFWQLEELVNFPINFLISSKLAKDISVEWQKYDLLNIGQIKIYHIQSLYHPMGANGEGLDFLNDIRLLLNPIKSAWSIDNLISMASITNEIASRHKKVLPSYPP